MDELGAADESMKILDNGREIALRRDGDRYLAVAMICKEITVKKKKVTQCETEEMVYAATPSEALRALTEAVMRNRCKVSKSKRT